MTRKAPLLIHVSRKELSAALRREQRPRIRKRLLALRVVLDGQTSAVAARAARTTTTFVNHWIQRAWQEGLASVLRPQAYARRRNAMATEQTTSMRAEIAAASARCPYGRLRSRLRAIDAFLAGQHAAEAAIIAQVKAGTLLGWLRFIRKLGITAALTRWQAPRKPQRAELHADPARVRALAAIHSGRNTQRKLLALALVADGMPVPDAAIQAGVSEHTVRAAIRSFRREGYAIFSSRRKLGRQVKLTPRQLEILRVILRQNPAIRPDTLCARILDEFGVRYSPWGVTNLLRKQLGIFRSVPAAQPSQTKNIPCNPPT
jgi:transposase